ncbi:ABC transporter permease [uncultured Pseudoflavonifractor sp.]|uniref:ABC transporter permease n=1 Tax=uncultured Pseudoflavonifractor sp. TaxID=1221379 RepID=UPI00260113E4|nr:ABC transporter permease [uncultured Pseudoflavonifractor sp.]
MAKHIAKRLLQLIPVLLLVSIFSFLIIHFAPGDPLNMYIRPDMTPEEMDTLRANLGLDGTIVDQYLGWLNNVLHGNLGNSLTNSGQPVADRILEVLPNTILLMGTSLVLSFVISIPLGLIAGLKKNQWPDQIISFFSYIGISIPSFWFGLILIIVFSLVLKVLPGSGIHTIGDDSLLDLIRHLIMPSLVLSVGNVATFTRYIRSATISQLEEEYVLTAKAKGVSQRGILFSHVLKNCLLPVITLAGMRFSSLVTGSFIVESVFGWPGMGTLGMSAINNLNYPMIMGFTMLSCLLLIVGNLIADLLYYVADPRIKSGFKEAQG